MTHALLLMPYYSIQFRIYDDLVVCIITIVIRDRYVFCQLHAHPHWQGTYESNNLGGFDNYDLVICNNYQR